LEVKVQLQNLVVQGGDRIYYYIRVWKVFSKQTRRKMNPNEELINKFYEAFQNKDPDAMKTCYSKDVTFSDEVFKNLDYRHVNGMWSMLIRRGKGERRNL